VTGLEALIRWRHPTRGIVEPDQFIPLAESTGMIVPIGRWLLQEACLQAAGWHRDGHPVGIAVNVSGRQLDSDGFLDDVRDALSQSRLDPSMLTLEITKTTLMQDPERATARLEPLKELGVRIAGDDFDTGYGARPLDVEGIDKLFDRHPTSEQLALLPGFPTP
jgi:EAL domain-containing protein (putative c-di-GMP-specific phosphodiesterase class I)